MPTKHFFSLVDYMTAHELMRKAQIISCPELSDSITGKRLTRLKRPPLRLLESDSDITDIEDSMYMNSHILFGL